MKRDLKLISAALNSRPPGAGLDELTDRQLGCPLPGDQPALAERLGRAHPSWTMTWRSVPNLLDEGGRVPERPLPRAVKARGHYPTEQAAMKCLYLVTRSLDSTGKGQTRWTREGSQG